MTSSFVRQTSDASPPVPTKEQVDKNIAALGRLLSEVNPLELISQATFFHHQAPDEISDDGIVRSEAQVEYLVSLVTARSFPSNAAPSTPATIDACLKQLNETYRQAARFHTSNTGELSFMEARLLAQLRMSTLFHRGPAARIHLDRMYWDVAPTHDEFLRQHYGFDTRQLQELILYAAEAQQAEYEKRRAIFLGIYRPLLAEAAKVLGITESHSGLWERCLSAPEFDEFRRIHSASIHRHFCAIDAMAAPSAFQIVPRDVCDSRILQQISHKFGENHAFWEEVPSWRGWPLNASLIQQKPVTRHEDRYYLFLRPLLIRGALKIIEGLLRTANTHYWQHTFLPKRDLYVEQTAIALIHQAIPDATCFPNVRYRCTQDGQSKLVEVDGIFVYDDCVLIVEAKATGLGEASRRGARGSLAADYKESIGAAYGQGKRLLAILRANQEVPLYDEAGNELLRLRHADFRHSILISVTRDTFGVTAAHLAAMRELGLLPGDDWPWAVDLHALRVVTELLPRPAVFLHYLLRRIASNRMSKLIVVDEYDLLGLFFSCGLVIPDSAIEDFGVVLAGSAASEIHEYYNGTERGESASKPKYPLAGRAAALLDALAREKPIHFASVSLRILEALSINRTALEDFITEAERAFKRRSVSQLAVFGNRHDLSSLGFALGTSLLSESDRSLALVRAGTHKLKLNLPCLTVILWRPPLKFGRVEIHEI